jgi:putative ABC transport system ATP-binding protein
MNRGKKMREGQMNGAMTQNRAAGTQVSSNIVFQVSGLTKVYDMGEVKVQALRGIDLELLAGELIVLLGPSGSGKSTLLNILGGLDTATSGRVAYCGKDLTSATEQELTEYRRYHIGFVFQFYNLIPSLTARENVSVVTEIAKNPMPPEDALALVGLSGGEQQRIAIARAISKNPEVLLCDEPTGALDLKTGIVVLEALERVNRELGTATAIITHNVDIAAMADRVVHLSNGLISQITQNAVKKPPRELRW